MSETTMTQKSTTFDWDKFAVALKNEFGESLVEEADGEEDAYNWWLTDVTVTDIVEFVKNYKDEPTEQQQQQ